jgi:transcriptional regulator with XRE-family HTH domain
MMTKGIESSWRERLRLAIAQDGRKQAAIAWQAGVAPETLSRILNGANPHLETVAKIAHACGTTVGWLLREHGYSLSAQQRRQLRDAAALIIEATT